MSLGDKVLKSSILMIAASWIKRTIGIISMVVLARLLMPSDYGLVAIAALVIKFFEVFSQTGFGQYILSRKDLTDEELNTAWSLKLISRIVLFVVVVAGAFPIAAFYDKPELAYVLLALAIVPILNGLESPSLLLFSRNFNYRKVALVTVSTKLLAFAATVTVAWQYQSYWALVIGDIVLAASYTFFTYRLHPVRPKWCLSNWRAQWGFSKWVLLRGILGYTRAKFDSFVISKFYGLQELGTYTLAKEIATMPHTQVTQPVVNIFISSITENKDDMVKTADSFSKMFVCLVSFLTPVAIGVYLLAHLIIPLALGENWLLAIPVVQALALLSLTYSMTMAISASLTALDKVKAVFYLNLITFLGVAPTIWLASSLPIVEFAIARTLLGFFIFFCFFIYLMFQIPISLMRLLTSLFPMLVSSAAMFWGLQTVIPLLTEFHPAVQLFMLFAIGAILFTTIFVALIWLMSKNTNDINFMQTLFKTGYVKVRTKFAGS